MRDITLIMAYYENPGMLDRQIKLIDGLPSMLRERVRLIVVDDGSPKRPAASRPTLFDFVLFRMEKDIRWNQDACRNIGAHHCKTEWMILTDIDHMVPRETWQRIIFGPLDPNVVYKFSRCSEPDLEPYKPHPNSWLLTKTTFDLIGGYDERFAGWYGTDFDFRNRAAGLLQIVTLKEMLIRVPREVTPDASTTTYKRKTEQDGEAIKRIRAERGTMFNPIRLSFPYHRVNP